MGKNHILYCELSSASQSDQSVNGSSNNKNNRSSIGLVLPYAWMSTTE